MKLLHRYPLFFLVACLILFSSQVVAASGPTEQLRPTLDKLIAVLADPALKGDANKIPRREKMMQLAADRFDFREMSRLVLGQTWREITPEQQKHFTGLMTSLLEQNYMGQIEQYSGEEVKFVGERIKGERAQVSTTVQHQGSEFPVDYILKLEGDRWMVYDVNIEGIRLINNYRSEFRSILRKDKYEGLVKMLEDKVASIQ